VAFAFAFAFERWREWFDFQIKKDSNGIHAYMEVERAFWCSSGERKKERERERKREDRIDECIIMFVFLWLVLGVLFWSIGRSVVSTST
jgi:hypothetical protein